MKCIRHIAILAAAFVITGSAYAQDVYPDRPVRIMLGFAAGSGADIPARFVVEQLRQISNGATFIVDNRPGASGNIAVDAGAKAKPDGYTLLLASTATTAGNAALYKPVPFDVKKELVPIAALHENGFALAINPATPAKTVAELTQLLKAKGKKATYGWATTVGLAASVAYTTGAGLDMTPVAYKITPDAVRDLAAGALDFVFVDTLFASGQEKQGRIRLMAVTTESVAPNLPDVPTMNSLGYRTSDTTPIWAMWAPAGTPKPILDKLGGWFMQVAASKAYADFLLNNGGKPVIGDAAFMTKKLDEAITAWNKVAEVAKIDAN
jgi:tripartite-type tricarboxylate transporter receptor subunit TctC